MTRPAAKWGELRQVHVMAMGYSITDAGELAYDGLDLDSAKVGIGLPCRLCDRVGCRSRAFRRCIDHEEWFVALPDGR